MGSAPSNPITASASTSCHTASGAGASWARSEPAHAIELARTHAAMVVLGLMAGLPLAGLEDLRTLAASENARNRLSGRSAGRARSLVIVESPAHGGFDDQTRRDGVFGWLLHRCNARGGAAPRGDVEPDQLQWHRRRPQRGARHRPVRRLRWAHAP